MLILGVFSLLFAVLFMITAIILFIVNIFKTQRSKKKLILASSFAGGAILLLFMTSVFGSLDKPIEKQDEAAQANTSDSSEDSESTELSQDEIDALLDKYTDDEPVDENKALKNEKNISYKMLSKSDKYSGEPYHITKGKIMQAQEDDGYTVLLVEVTEDDGYWDDLIMISYDGETDAVDDDFVEVTGTIGDKETYETKIGQNTVPTMTAEKIKIIK